MKIAGFELTNCFQPLIHRLIVEGVFLRGPAFGPLVKHHHRTILATVIAPGTDVPVHPKGIVEMLRQRYHGVEERPPGPALYLINSSSYELSRVFPARRREKVLVTKNEEVGREQADTYS